MNLEDKEYLRALYAGMAMIGVLMINNEPYDDDAVADLSIRLADKLLERLEPKEGGIAKARKSRVQNIP
jgi:hypothetical protein